MSDPEDASEGSGSAAGEPRTDAATEHTDPADLADDLAALVADHPQLEELAQGLSGVDTVSSEQQHDRLASADEKLRAILDEGPRPSAR